LATNDFAVYPVTRRWPFTPQPDAPLLRGAPPGAPRGMARFWV